MLGHLDLAADGLELPAQCAATGDAESTIGCGVRGLGVARWVAGGT